ncbi:MAG: HAMP domain-containing protein [Myxococcales bacterium]|nr:HAMP domain-containing protein [Myxococcales bacterium]
MKHRHCPHAHRHPVHRRWHHKKKLQRRIFMWFGASILFTALVVVATFRLLSPTERIQRDAEGFERFASGRVAAVWDDPAARDELFRDMHRDLQLDVTLYDTSGAILVRQGAACAEPWAQLPIHARDGAPLGRVVACGEPYRWGGWRFAVVILMVVLILWLASGIMAARLLRPLRHLEDMARRIGDGDLSARARLDPHHDGELGMLGSTMNEMVARIEKQLADQRELLAAVSHELRTPLGHLRLLVEMGREKPSTKTIDEIEKEVLEIDALVAQLLATSRLDFGTLHTKAFDPIELAETALARFDLDVTTLEVEGERALMEADPTLLGRAVANLLGNASQHGGGVTRLLIRFEANEVVFAVEDAGPGFSPGEREKVFEAFYRGEHRAGASLGLGLSLVSRIAKAHGGRAWVEDVPGGGARVLFSISAVPAEASETAQAAE